ncbi:MAG: DUF1015 domain-containing protein [Firmicutes bacterium]|nr:DUF1015 domain-containing protein [Bacillota bacterium]
MATILPFKGLRYNGKFIENLAGVVTPPYDVIDPAAQDRYYKSHPYNIIRLEYGKTFPGDTERNNRYTRAAADFAAWRNEMILVPEKGHALYLYEQEYTVNGGRKVRSGLICAVKLEPYEKGIILPHEETLPKHKADRLELMRACRANFSPIFSLYADREMAVTGALREDAGKRAPDVSFTGENGEEHRLWVILDPEIIGRVQQLMADRRIFIADGHHRYETALNYKKERDAGAEMAPGGAAAVASSCARGPGGRLTRAFSSEPPYHYVMMTLVNLYDPGLIVLPTHRLVKNVSRAELEALPGRLAEDFDLEEFPLEPRGGNFKKFLTELAARGASRAGHRLHRHVFGVYTGGKLLLASLKDEENLLNRMPPDKSPAWCSLDVSVLHTLVIEKHLGICSELRAKGEHITYTREEEGALQAVDRGEYQLAFFLNPTLVEEVTAVAANGEKMPQKSTYFYPKLLTGLVVNSLE